jgi:hypothetical protein
VVQAAKVPVYALVDTWLGEGIVGGYLFRIEEIARKTGELSARLLNGASLEKVSAVPVCPTPMFDWRQLKRWGISEDRLPLGSIVRFRRHTLWEVTQIIDGAANDLYQVTVSINDIPSLSCLIRIGPAIVPPYLYGFLSATVLNQLLLF